VYYDCSYEHGDLPLDLTMQSSSGISVEVLASTNVVVLIPLLHALYGVMFANIRVELRNESHPIVT